MKNNTKETMKQESELLTKEKLVELGMHKQNIIIANKKRKDTYDRCIKEIFLNKNLDIEYCSQRLKTFSNTENL